MAFTNIYLATFYPLFPTSLAFLIPLYTFFAILLAIAILHFYWAFGRKWGLEKSLPAKKDGTLLFTPTPWQCVVVGVGFILMIGFIILGMIHQMYAQIPYPQFENPYSFLPVWMYDYGFWLLGGIFTLRAIGDFSYVGFFKKVKSKK